jgi:hypothetical protein
MVPVLELVCMTERPLALVPVQGVTAVLQACAPAAVPDGQDLQPEVKH